MKNSMKSCFNVTYAKDGNIYVKPCKKSKRYNAVTAMKYLMLKNEFGSICKFDKCGKAGSYNANVITYVADDKRRLIDLYLEEEKL